MASRVAPCGTFTAYKRHKRNGEPVDDDCREAARVESNEGSAREAEKRVESAKLTLAEKPVEESVDELVKLRWNLRILEAAMEAGMPSGLAAASRQHMDLVAKIKKLEAANEPKGGVMDDIARRRKARLAGS